MRGSACAAVTSDGCYGLYGGNMLLVYDLHAPAGSVASLTISCPQFELYCQETLSAYQLANPQLNIALTSYEAITGEAFLQSFHAGSAADILGLDNLELLEDMIQKGYCADLSGSNVIASLVERMEPRLAERFCRDGKIYGVPYYAVFPRCCSVYSLKLRKSWVFPGKNGLRIGLPCWTSWKTGPMTRAWRRKTSPCWASSPPR